MLKPSNPPAMTKEEHRQSTRVATTIYALVLLSFLSLCTIAVIATSTIERNKQGFRPITVKKPISIFDTTYLKSVKQAD